MSLNFSGVEEAKELRMTPPGTIDVFKIQKVEFNASKNKGTMYMGVQFSRKEDGFQHSFFLTEKALPRIQSLVKAATGKALDGEMEEQGMISMLEGKEIALRVTGKISENGKGYPDLPFGGFAKPAKQKDELTFSVTEKAQIAKTLEAIMNASSTPTESSSKDDSASDFAGAMTSSTEKKADKPLEASKGPAPKADDDIF